MSTAELSENTRAQILERATAARVVLTMRQAREGDPFPLIETLWGKIVRPADVIADRSVLLQGRILVLDEFQEDLIRSTFTTSIREVFVKGNTGCGKGAGLAIVACVYFLIYNDARIVITRDSYQPAVDLTFGEVAKWWKRMAWQPGGYELTTTSLYETAAREHKISVASPSSAEGFSGAHSAHVLFIFDEATAAVLNPRFGLADTQATKFLALANPRTVFGSFRQAFEIADDPDESQTVLGPMGYRRLITVDGANILNVRAKCLENPVAPKGGIEINGRKFSHGEIIPDEHRVFTKPIVPGQTCYDTWLGLCANPDPDYVAWAARGKFPNEDRDTTLIFRSWTKSPRERWGKFQRTYDRAQRHRNAENWVERLNNLFPVEAFGLDVGGSTDGDPSVLTAGGDRGIRMQHEEQIRDAPAVAEWVVRLIHDVYGIAITQGGVPICVDTDGIGWGVAGILSKMGCLVIEFRGNESSDVDPKRYRNKRAEAYGELAKRLNPDDQWKGQVFVLPDSQPLVEELCAPQKVFVPGGHQFGISPKRPVPGVKKQEQSVYDMIRRSSDRGDSAVYFYRALQVKGRDLSVFLDAGFF